MLSGVGPQVACCRNRTADEWLSTGFATSTGIPTGGETEPPGPGFVTFRTASPPTDNLTMPDARSCVGETNGMVSGSPASVAVAFRANPEPVTVNVVAIADVVRNPEATPVTPTGA